MMKAVSCAVIWIDYLYIFFCFCLMINNFKNKISDILYMYRTYEIGFFMNDFDVITIIKRSRRQFSKILYQKLKKDTNKLVVKGFSSIDFFFMHN